MQSNGKQKLMFFVAQDVGDGLKSSVKQLVERLADKRSWVTQQIVNRYVRVLE